MRPCHVLRRQRGGAHLAALIAQLSCAVVLSHQRRHALARAMCLLRLPHIAHNCAVPASVQACKLPLSLLLHGRHCSYTATSTCRCSTNAACRRAALQSPYSRRRGTVAASSPPRCSADTTVPCQHCLVASMPRSRSLRRRAASPPPRHVCAVVSMLIDDTFLMTTEGTPACTTLAYRRSSYQC